MRAFYYLFYNFLITCFQYTSTNVGGNLGGLDPKPLMSAAYALYISEMMKEKDIELLWKANRNW